MEGDLIKINEWLLPLSWFYGIGADIKNTLFDIGILRSKTFDIPIICVGNITVGGTGKTPHAEYLIRLLKKKYKVAFLSRGYKRHSKGYVLASTETPMEYIGDEPWQIKQKFPDIHVAVDANRCRGIERLMQDEATRDTQVIILDDAYQHRYVKAGMNILIVDYHRMITDDRLLPAGRLREKAAGKNRAHMVIVSKCPHNIPPMGFRVIQSALQLKPYQKLLFSTLRYGKLQQVFGEKTIELGTLRKDNVHILLLTGIGSPMQMEQDLRRYAQHIKHLAYPDHYFYTDEDVKKLNHAIQELPHPRIIITTEKDATRLQGLKGLDETTQEALYVLPIEVEIMRHESTVLNKCITDYVHENIRNRNLDKK